MKKLTLDMDYVVATLVDLVKVPSPSGYTDAIVHRVGDELQKLGVRFELTRRGAIRASFPGRIQAPARALVAHLDTLGMMVHSLKDTGRLSVVPIGTWSSRFAEGARVTILTERGARRGTVLPLKASGHTFNEEIDTQPVAWTNLEIRVDEVAGSKADLAELGFQPGDFVAVDPQPEVSPSGFINSRHLDDKAGVSVLLGLAKALREGQVELPMPLFLLLTISEEVGVGASAVLHGDVSEMVAIDNSIPAPGQHSTERGVTIAVLDSSGPFDWHLTRRLLEICEEARIPYTRDLFRYYRCDAAAALEAGNDIRTALACFGVDASHGHERTHVDSLRALGEMLSIYVQGPPAVAHDRLGEMAPFKGFPTQPIEPVEE